ncbi:MAG: hypothetical protein ACK57B_06495 [Betaproteobacteria bacterium]
MNASAPIKTAIAAILLGTSALAAAQVSNIPFPSSQSLNGSVGASVVFESTDSSVVVFTNTRASNVTARLTDFVITNGGSSTCFLHFANASGDILLAELAIPPMQTLVVNLGNGVPLDFNRVLRAVRSDLFGAPCLSRLVVSVRGWFTAAS